MAIGEIVGGAAAIWHFNGNSLDASGNGLNLTDNNGPTNVVGKFGGAKQYVSASSQWSGTGAPSQLDWTDVFTWMCWFNRTSGTDGAVMSKSSSGSGKLRRLYMNNDTTWHFLISDVTGGDVSTGATTTGKWYFLAGVYDGTGGTQKIWLGDGTSLVKSQNPVSGTPGSVSSDEFAIGRDGSFGNNFNGLIDEAVVFHKALSDQEIKKYYYWALGRTNASL